MSGDHAIRLQRRSLIASICLNLGFGIAELTFGLLANSLVLVANALHDTSDAVALALSLFGLQLSLRPPDTRRTFGYRKARILTAFINTLVLVALTVVIIYHAINRLFIPRPVNGTTLILLSFPGLIVNGIAVLLLRRARKSLNVRAAMWHLLEDFCGWIAILVGGVIIRLTGWHAIDSFLSMAVGGLVLLGAWSVFRESASILIDSTPRDLTFEEVRRFILDFAPEIQGLHDLHIWTLGEGERALMAHLVVPDSNVGSFQSMLSRLEDSLLKKFNINHVTFELECSRCKSQTNTCLDQCLPKRES